MKKAVLRSVVAILLIAAAIGAGFLAERIYGNIRSRSYPRSYSALVTKYSDEYGVPKDVIYAVIKVESGFSPSAESPKGAIGLMQLMPSTYEWLCGKVGVEYDEEKITDPETNIKCGTYYLSYLYNEFAVWETVYAAYNAGQGTVREWLATEEYSKDGHLTKIPYAETSRYVEKVSEAREVYLELLGAEESR